MSFLQNALKIMDLQMTTPGLYGWFHLLWLGITAGVSVYLSVFCRNDKDEQVRRRVLVTAVIVTVLELYKQINFSFSYTDGIKFDYQWYAFPFQFCSTPMYVGLLAGLTKKGKIHSAACAYLATYSVFAGVCVMLYPATVFVPEVGINIQTMFCHGSMIWVGAYLLATGYVKIEHKTVLRALPVFAVCVTLAVVGNEIAFRSGLLESESLNLFFISPYCDPHLPVYSIVQGIVPFPLCLVIYILGFTVAAWLILLMIAGIRKLLRIVRKNAVQAL